MGATAADSGLPQLKGRQAAASDPAAHVWLSASAGTGKTQVLAARVYRLLLRGVDPAAILCLTFTKAGAAEMAGRIGARLAAWVRMPTTQLSRDLAALGERPTPALQDRARTLFASVLDAPGGGVRIQTIHGFCQSLLAAFPIEAGLAPGFRPLEPREEAALGREALAAMLERAEREGRRGPVEAIGALSRRMGEGGAEQFLAACARSLPGLEALPPAIGPWLRRALDLPVEPVAAVLAARCAAIDGAVLDRLAAANRDWGTATGASQAEAIAAWLAAGPAGRAEGLADLASVVLTAKGEARKASAKLIALEPDYEALAATLGSACGEALGVAARIGYADLLAAALEAGRDYARGYALAKRRAGAVDFDDLIDRAAALLERDDIGEWVRYKLDQSTEHILIDEAQDTNIAQWRIVAALSAEFFAGRGTRGAGRTIFTVGDYKQAIFGFQGTDPDNFAAAEQLFRARAEAARGDDDWPEAERGPPFARLSLTQSFRSTRPVLDFVDAALAELPEPGLGALEAAEPHVSEVAGSGSVTLWPPTLPIATDDGEEDWADDAERRLATDIARTIGRWLRDGELLGSKGRPLRAEDVMILVRRRGTLAALIVARLYAEGVSVAGIDRLRLNAPLAVQDLLAAIRFVLQPDDDLSLASLLVSPLLGWSQDELMAAATERAGLSLWRHLQRHQPAERLAPLEAMLARADFTTPHRFLEELLSGPLDGRRKLILRLGQEARDPIEELVSAALAFERAAPPSLQGFLDWFDRGDVEIVRDAAQPQPAVRVMTAHGAKGLQAPVVILADATVDPANAPRSLLRWSPEPGGDPIPIFRPRADERGGPLDTTIAAADRRDLEEHWRLFYVAATRAEEQLIVAGALGPRAKGAPPVQSWYAAAARAMTALGVPESQDARRYEGGKAVATRKPAASAAAETLVPLPAWAHQPAPAEARPPRPLAPSSLGEDAVAEPPPSPAMRDAAERGRLLHMLFERLPALAPDQRRAAAMRWLGAQGVAAGIADNLAAMVLAILEDARFAGYFVTDALAEAPITATLPDGLVVAGTVDRLVIEAQHVRFVDFKTGQRVPAGVADIPPYHLRQLAAYAAALRVIFPDRSIEGALLYTAGPALLMPPAEMLVAAMERLRAPVVERAAHPS